MTKSQQARRASVRKRTRKRAEQVALDIVQNIVHRGLAPGDKLPLESEMLAEYDVSRSSLREALRLLEVQGLITIRPGPGSGTEVGKVDPSNLSNTLALYLLMARSDLGQLLEAWRMVEPLLARLAATSGDRARVERLMRPFASSATTHEKALTAGLLFHDTVAELAENPVLSLILGAVGFLVTEQVRLGAPGFELSDKTVHDHGRIADLILAGDGEAVAALMHEHLVAVTREMEAIIPLNRRGVLLQG
jgi:DNA-binding FadR family transcriptional regulator